MTGVFKSPRLLLALSLSACSTQNTSFPSSSSPQPEETAPKMSSGGSAQEESEDCPWPQGQRGALSLTYDDAMPSQLQNAVPKLNEAGLRATFFLTQVQSDEPWKEVLAAGHELAAHSQSHPCPKSYGVPGKTNEEFDLNSFAEELDQDLQQLARLGAKKPYSFAYPCGVSWVGEQESYIPLIEERFAAARQASGGVANAGSDLLEVPADFSLLSASALEAAIDRATESGSWLVLGFHGVGGDWLEVDGEVHDQLIDSLAERDDLWIAPFGEVAACAGARQPK